MAELQNGELLKEIYDMVKGIEKSVAVIATEQVSQAKLTERNYQDIEKIKWRGLVATISIIVALIAAWFKK